MDAAATQQGKHGYHFVVVLMMIMRLKGPLQGPSWLQTQRGSKRNGASQGVERARLAPMFCAGSRGRLCKKQMRTRMKMELQEDASNHPALVAQAALCN